MTGYNNKNFGEPRSEKDKLKDKISEDELNEIIPLLQTRTDEEIAKQFPRINRQLLSEIRDIYGHK